MPNRLDHMDAADLSSVAVVNPGWYGYAYGVGGDNSMIIDEGPNSLVGESLIAAELIDAPARWNPFAMLAPRQNSPPLLFDGAAQRAHPNILALAEFTPIGPGEIHLQDIRACASPQDVYELATWQSGVGQIANNIALVYAAASNQGDPASAGAGLTLNPFDLPYDATISYVDEYAPNAGASEVTP